MLYKEKLISKFFSRALVALTVTCLVFAASAATAQREEVDLDEAGAEESLNAQLWEFARHTPYSQAKLYLSGLKKPRAPEGTELTLPTGWKLLPAGQQVEVGRLPSEVVAYAGKLVVLNGGYYSNGVEQPEVSVLDAAGNAATSFRLPTLFPSAVAGADGDLYMSGGVGKVIYRLNKALETVRTYKLDGFAGGITVIDSSHIAVALMVTAKSDAELLTGAYQPGKVAVLNTVTGMVERTAATGYYPYAIAYVNSKLYTTVLGEDRVGVFSYPGLELKAGIAVGTKPQGLCLDGGRLFVVNTGSDSVSVIDTANDKLAGTYYLSANHDSFGKAAVSCCVDKATSHLFVAQSNSNAVAVLDSNTGRNLGEIPVGWYPTKCIEADGNLVVLNGKGIRNRRPNVNGPQPAEGRGGPDYVLTLLKGSVSLVPVSDISANLSKWSKTVSTSSPQLLTAKRPQIKHVFYIVRENRTYDQILGDLPKANGDPNLTLFGREVTPNGHKIAESFVTLDNYFADGEISVLGHSFTTSGYASPFLEWLGNASYSGRFPGYPFGMVPAATSPAYLWDALDRKGIDYRIYGENYYLYTRAYDLLKQSLGQDSEATHKFYAQMMKLASMVDRGAAFYKFASSYYGKADTPEAANALLSGPDFLSELSHFLCGDDTLTALISQSDELKARFAVYLAHYPFNYRSWDLKSSDLDRVKAWKLDFDKQVGTGKVAAFNYLWLPNDHTGGTSKAYLPPDQLVAQNDAALGYLLETISHSPIWKNTLVLVTEDDAQNGPDHVDATRTVALAAGPFIKRGAVISDRFDQLSLIRTIGLALGFQPLNQNDALATPMYSIFAPKPDYTPYLGTTSTHLADDDKDRFKALTEKK